MLRLPYKCDGIISEKCKCSSIHTSSSDGLVVSTLTGSDRRPLTRIAKHHKEESNTYLLTRILRDFYEKCAAYNLRCWLTIIVFAMCEVAGGWYMIEARDVAKKRTFGGRYCSITGFVKHSDNYFKHVVKDVAVLICFVATNFVVCVGITSKTVVHMLLFFSITLKWLMRKFFLKNSATAGKELFWAPRPSEPFKMQSASKTD